MECKPELTVEMWQRAEKIELILMDVDGVLTDGQIVYNTKGEEIKFFNAYDGLGIRLAQKAGLKTGIISARESEAIRIRAKELDIDILFLGKYDKFSAYKKLKEESDFHDEQICFIGDDLPDIPVLNCVGLPIAVKNATTLVKEQIPFHTTKEGGRGAIRELVEFILQAQGKLDRAMEYVTKLD